MTHIPLRPRNLLLLLTVTPVWGVNFAVIKVGVADVPPLMPGSHTVWRAFV